MNTDQQQITNNIKEGDEFITAASGFPPAIHKIMEYGAVPVFIDIKIPHYNIDETLLENALNPKTKAVILGHALGNPFNIKTIKNFCSENNLYLLEDNTHACGAFYMVNKELQETGTFGNICINSGNEHACTSLKRRVIWAHLREGLLKLQDKLILPEAEPYSVPCWTGFAITCKETKDRNMLAEQLTKNNIKTEFFTKHEKAGVLPVTDRILNDSFWIEITPNMPDETVNKIIEAIKGCYSHNE